MLIKAIWFLVFACVVTAYPGHITNNNEINDDLKRVTLDNFLNNTFRQTGFSGIWISESEFTFRDKDENFAKYNAETGATTVLIEKSVLDKWKPSTLELNADNSLVLIRYQDRQLFRHSIIARYVVYDWFNKKEMNIANGEEIQLCIWSPDGESIAYVDKNNVYYQVFEPGTETSMVYKITTDGIPDKIYNGFCDWVYEEEVFGNSKAMWFSSDGQFLAFIHFDDTDVKSETYYMYGDIGKLESQYPTKISLKYPKAGETNPTVEIRVIDLTNIDDSFKVIIPPTDIEDAIVGSVGWLTDRVVGQYVTVLWLNRRQNNATLMAYQALQPTVFNTIENFVELDGWVDADQLHCYEYEEDNSCFIKANDNGWKRIVRIEFSTKFKTNLTPDGVTALQFLGFSSSKNETYAITTAHNINPITDSAFRHLYKINENGEFQCMSCNVLSPDQDTCTYVSNVRFSTDYSFFSFTCSGPGPAYTKIFKNNAQMDEVIVWESNDQVRNLLKEYYRTEIKYLQVPVGPQKEFLASVKLHMPFCYDPTSTRKYPMIVQVYGGPNSVRVLDNFAVGFADYLAQSRNVIFAQIDGRGSGNKGTKMLFTINNGMGTVEIEDQIEVVKYLVENHNFINAEQIGIWGWSYGGYASGMVLVHDDDHVFQGGISVAPVSSWIYYDTIYTERYMGRPLINENLNGYNVSDLNRYAKKMANHEYMLIHGNADDNVHYQQAMVWSRALIDEGIIFEQLSYPDEAHGLVGVSRHLYHSMDSFWTKCLKLSPSDEKC